MDKRRVIIEELANAYIELARVRNKFDIRLNEVLREMENKLEVMKDAQKDNNG